MSLARAPPPLLIHQFNNLMLLCLELGRLATWPTRGKRDLTPAPPICWCAAASMASVERRAAGGARGGLGGGVPGAESSAGFASY